MSTDERRRGRQRQRHRFPSSLVRSSSRTWHHSLPSCLVPSSSCARAYMRQDFSFSADDDEGNSNSSDKRCLSDFWGTRTCVPLLTCLCYICYTPPLFPVLPLILSAYIMGTICFARHAFGQRVRIQHVRVCVSQSAIRLTIVFDSRCCCPASALLPHIAHRSFRVTC